MNTEIGDYYSGLQDEELLLIAGDRDSLSEDAKYAIDAEMAKRGLDLHRAKVVKRTVDRFRARDEQRTKSLIIRKKLKLNPGMNPGWGLIPTLVIVVLYLALVPRQYKLPDEWDQPALVALLCTCMLPFIYYPRWKSIAFWIAVIPAAAFQLWMAHAWLNYSKDWGSTRSGGKLIWSATLLLGIGVFHVAFSLLRRWLDTSPDKDSGTPNW